MPSRCRQGRRRRRRPRSRACTTTGCCAVDKHGISTGSTTSNACLQCACGTDVYEPPERKGTPQMREKTVVRLLVLLAGAGLVAVAVAAASAPVLVKATTRNENTPSASAEYLAWSK